MAAYILYDHDTETDEAHIRMCRAESEVRNKQLRERGEAARWIELPRLNETLDGVTA
jgi:hypothetical protein